MAENIQGSKKQGQLISFITINLHNSQYSSVVVMRQDDVDRLQELSQCIHTYLVHTIG